MPSKIRHGLLMSLIVTGLFVIWFGSSYAGSINYIYDELNRLKRVEYGDGSVVEYTYDKAGNRLEKRLQIPDTTPPTTTASPVGGIYNTAQSVTLTCNDGYGSGCDKIYYTTDGTTPTTSSLVYSSPINISVTTTLKFFAKDLAGNSESVKTQTYTIDTTAPTGTITIDSEAAITTSTAVTLTLSCSDTNGCSQMQFSNDNVTYSTPETYTTTKAWTLTSGDGTKTVCAKFKDTADNWSTAYSDTIVLDTTPPTGTITINSGAASTNSSNVTLTLSCSDANGCSQMQFSNDNVTYSSAEAYGTTKAWTLTSGGGTRTVYVKFMDTAGNWSAAFSNTILLDTTPPATTASPIGGTYSTAQSVTLTCNDGSGSGCDKIYYTADGSTPTTSSPVYSSPINVQVTTTLKFFARDLAGNSETVKTETYTISTNMVTVELKDSTGGPLSGGVVQYYSGGWQTFGTTDTSGRVSRELQPGTYTFSMSYAFVRQEKSQNTATNPTVVFQTTKVTIELRDSANSLMDTGTVQYYSGGWRDIGTTSGGQVSKELLPGSYTFSMNYGFARQEKSQNIATNPIVVFQTISATVQLKDSTGALMDTGTVQYYSGGWRDIGSTSGGQVTKELLPGSYTFSMNYAFARQEKAQNIASNPTVVFQTISATVQLKDSTGALMDTGTVQYYSGGWRDIGSTSGGQVTKELLPGTYTFSMNYAFARQEKSQNVATNPTVVFQTTKITVQLKDSTGALMDTGTVQYYSGGWRDIGSTSGGQVTKELLPRTYTFSMNYAFARQEKSQNVATNPTVVFQTTKITVQLKDSTGALMDTGTVQYYSGGWRDIGSTSGGQVTKELLPGSYTFSMNYAFARQEKAQNIASNPTVVFQTISATVQLKDSTGALMDTGTVQYYSGGWRDIGTTSGGQVSKELLPLTYTFSMTYGLGRQEKSQNIATNPTVVFQTGQVHSDSGACTQYYASGWRTFVSTTEYRTRRTQ